MQLPIGTRLHSGTYRIVSVLGQGSFGITYLAEHVNLGKKVAIKEFFMKELNSRDEDGSITGMSDGSLSLNYFKKFKKEAINLSNLDHPNIVRVTDSFGENGTFYYVMDFIEGQNLNDYVKHHHVDADEAISIICSVADALIYMHEQKHMLHLDLKPSNVMRRASDGRIYLIDFGLSKHYSDDGTPDTSTTIGLGTAGYAPIEQGNKSKDGEFRPTIDVYALGATFYKLLTGETPPVASDLLNDKEALSNNLRTKGIPDGLIAVVEKAMNLKVNKRYQSIRAFKDALSTVGMDDDATIVDPRLLGGDNAQKPEPEVVPVTAKPVSPNRKAFKNVASIIVVSVIALIMIGVLAHLQYGSDNYVTQPAEDNYVENVRLTINNLSCSYTGEFSGWLSAPHGKGEAKFDDGRYYKGPFNNGVMSGKDGYFKFPNGDYFFGNFDNNHFDYGKYTVYQSGEYFFGSFTTDGQPKSGTWYDKNGNVLENV